MHIILPVLGAVITILILLNRLESNGIDIGWLNPFAWKRRREWAKKYHANPVYSLDNPMQVTALVMAALAKSEGEISAEQKKEILGKYQEVFHLSEKAAGDLFSSVIFLIKDDLLAVQNVEKLLGQVETSLLLSKRRLQFHSSSIFLVWRALRILSRKM
ncbi:MAG: hypothetical protein JAZ13_00040 [Candidatus Thiodiazotropha taylori]|nr:hypothetical protein [Candidatus Thiodiazotropha taylori]